MRAQLSVIRLLSAVLFLFVLSVPFFIVSCTQPAPVVRCAPGEPLYIEEEQLTMAEKSTAEIPLIDSLIPERVETATFALG